MVKKQTKIKPIFALVLANAIWGITPAFNKIGLRQFSPLWFFVIRYFFAAIISVFIFKQRGRKIKPQDHIRIAMSAWVGISLTIVTMYYGLKITRASDAAVISSLGPIILFWLSIIFLRERFRWQPLIGTMVALAGSLFLVLGPVNNANSYNGSNYIWGASLVFFSIFVDQVGAIITQPLLKKYDMSRLAIWRLCYALVPVLILALILEPLPSLRVNLDTAISLFYLAFVAITIAFALYCYGARRLKVEEFSVLFYIDPVFGIVSSMLILGEQPTLRFLTGVLFIVAGILIAEVHIKSKLKFRVMHLPRH